MWWSEPRWRPRVRRRRAAPAAALIAALAVALAACGYRPLYGTQEGASAVGDLAAVRVTAIGDRGGHQLQNFLLDRLNPGGRPAKPLYSLDLELTESRQETAIRRDATATRANLIVGVNYELRELATGKILFKADSTATTSFNIVNSNFATTSAETDARRRAARVLSDEIQHRLAIFFNRRRAGT